MFFFFFHIPEPQTHIHPGAGKCLCYNREDDMFIWFFSNHSYKNFNVICILSIRIQCFSNMMCMKITNIALFNLAIILLSIIWVTILFSIWSTVSDLVTCAITGVPISFCHLDTHWSHLGWGNLIGGGITSLRLAYGQVWVHFFFFFL